MSKILLLEDSKEIYNMVGLATNNLAELVWAKSIHEAEQLDYSEFDLFLVDVELPDGNGISFCAKVIAEVPSASVFFLTAHKELSEKVLGFSAGADDYITKPFEVLELRARMEAKLRKNEIFKKENDFMKWDEISIDKNRQEVVIYFDGTSKTIDLTALEFKLLTYFARSPGHVIHRDKVLNDIWGQEVYVYPRSVDTHVSKLRRKLDQVSHIIESVRGAGYRFSPS